VTLVRGGQELYRARFSTDSRGCRITPHPDPGPRRKFLVFLGCSFTFGEGVNDDETMPAAAARLAPDHRVYNHGCSGHGPQSVLARISDPNWANQIRETEGTLVYTFIDGHVRRALGLMSVMQWNQIAPYYRVAEGDRLERCGNFLTGRPFVSAAYWILGQSEALRAFDVDIPPRLTDSHFAFAASMIEDAAREFREKFPRGRFVVMCHPRCRMAGLFIRSLRSKHIQVLDYSLRAELEDSRYFIQGDGHPNGKGYEAVTRTLLKDLGLTGAGGTDGS